MEHNDWKAFTILDALRDEIKANSPTHEPEDLSIYVPQADQTLGTLQLALMNAVHGAAPDADTSDLQDADLATLI